MPSRIMLRVFYTCMTCVCFLTVAVSGRICQSMEFRNKVKYLDGLANCTIIAGHLKIVLLENVDESAYEGVSFPELTEISDFLLMFRVQGLKSIGKLFPNLRIIRGNVLYSNFALVIYDLKDLTDIGLNSLQLIKRGGVKVDKCGKLCFVNSVNWPALGTTLDYTNHNLLSEYCGDCPPNCNGFCWNSEHCQILEQKGCHPQCMGCKKEHSDTSCLLCKNMRDGRRCVESCPSNKYLHRESSICITEAECLTYQKKPHWVFNSSCVDECPREYQKIDRIKGGCVFCGDNCTKECFPLAIRSYSSIDKMRGCTHILGSLEISLRDVAIMPALQRSLGRITEIDGYLKISRSPGVKNLYFLKNLRAIHGRPLFNRTYAIFIVENCNLQKLWNFGHNSLKVNNGLILFHNNPQLCKTDIYNLANVSGLWEEFNSKDIYLETNGEKAACRIVDLDVKMIERNATNVTLFWEPPKIAEKEHVVGYTIYYNYLLGSTGYESKDTCDAEEWGSFFTFNNTVVILALEPDTDYSYYIEVFTNISKNAGQTPLKEFKTAPGEPTEPLDLKLSATSRTIKFNWTKPARENGMNHYKIFGFLVRDDFDFISERDYCQNPQKIEDVSVMPPPEVEECSCLILWQMDRINVCPQDPFSAASKGCEKLLYLTAPLLEPEEDNISPFNDVGLRLRKRSVKKASKDIYNSTYIDIRIPAGNRTIYVLKNLVTFGLYAIFFSGCSDHNGYEICGSVVFDFIRTKKDISADDIWNIRVTVEDNTAFVKWIDPKEPNMMVLAYHAEYKNEEAEGDIIQKVCMTRKSFVQNQFVLKLEGLEGGIYSIRIRVVSLAGPGNFSPTHYFLVPIPTDAGSVILDIFLIFLSTAGAFGVIFCYCYIHHYELEDHQTLPDTGNRTFRVEEHSPCYDFGEWELDIKDLDIIAEIGHGTFGKTFEGRIKSKDLPCFIKATDCLENNFFSDAEKISLFNGTHHVVRLLGIISTVDPKLLVTAFMEKGDLKTFLKSSKPKGLTSKTIYRIASEIADGMAYLSSRNLIHGDLAARNCFLAADGTVKVAPPIGFMIGVYGSDYYQSDSVWLPVRWMSPETLTDGNFTSKSDIWSYGILLWEIATFGQLPYQGLSNEQVLQFVAAKGTLDRPRNCLPLLYEIMEACWQWRPSNRPSFVEVLQKLEANFSQNFLLVSFYNSSEGEAYKRMLEQKGVSDDVVDRFNVADQEIKLRRNKWVLFSEQD